MSKRDQKERQDRRKQRRVGRKQRRAARAATRGNEARADRINHRADQLDASRSEFLVWDRALIEQNKYRATAAELKVLREALDTARDQARDVRKYVDRLAAAADADRPGIWAEQAQAHFGDYPSQQHYRRFVRRTSHICDALLKHELFIALRADKDYYGRARASQANRPGSKNVRFKLDLPGHHGDVREMADTIVHEIVHTLDVSTDEPGNSTIGKALRDPDTYAKFFAF